MNRTLFGLFARPLLLSLGLVACGDAASVPSNTVGDAATGAGADVSAAPSVPARCTSACARIATCAAMDGTSVDTADCAASCARSAPSEACFGCFSGPCASSCGEACVQCFFNNCLSLVSPMPEPADAGAPAPPQDSGPPPVMCGTNALARDLGADCQLDNRCMAGVCQTNTRNALLSYCTQECRTIADCPCGDDWFCDTVPGRGDVVRYCQSRRRNGY